MEVDDSPQEKSKKASLSEPSIQLLFENLDLAWVTERIASRYSQRKRRPPVSPEPEIRAHIFKDLRQIRSFRKLEAVLAENEGVWARRLGFERPPRHQSFSAFRKRVGSTFFNEIFYEIRKHLLQVLPDLADIVVIDSSSVDAYGRPARGRRKSSDPDAKWGVRTNTRTGKIERFFGWKLHTAHAAKYGSAIDFIVTPGKNNDSPQYPKLIRMLSEAEISFNYLVADAGYDARSNYFTTIAHHAKPIIAYNRRSKPKGTKGRRLDFELPVPRNSPEWKEKYGYRPAVERQFSELKEQLGMKFLTLRGLEGVTIHLCISLTVLLVINLVAHLTGNPELLRSVEPWKYSNV